ncbi:MAG: radical SAM protein, partial [Bacteroidetes bacterium]|nr:radical SAM protein [Bacteroidota bacterium]
KTTIGCSWNKCAFCEMYTAKKFRVRQETEIFKDIAVAREWKKDIRKVFLADGNAMVLSFSKIKSILDQLNINFPKLTRVSAYSLPEDIEHKSVEELVALKEAGLSLLYVGIETGDDELLNRVGKGESFDSTMKNLLKAKEAGIKLSVMIINGLGGKIYSRQHALNSARIINIVQPEFLSTLVLSFPFGLDHFKSRFKGTFHEMSKWELLEELGMFISELNLDHVIFRSDHASNYLALKGILSRDQNKILSEIENAVRHPGSATLREEWQRGL